MISWRHIGHEFLPVSTHLPMHFPWKAWPHRNIQGEESLTGCSDWSSGTLTWGCLGFICVGTLFWGCVEFIWLGTFSSTVTIVQTGAHLRSVDSLGTCPFPSSDLNRPTLKPDSNPIPLVTKSGWTRSMSRYARLSQQIAQSDSHLFHNPLLDLSIFCMAWDWVNILRPSSPVMGCSMWFIMVIPLLLDTSLGWHMSLKHWSMEAAQLYPMIHMHEHGHNKMANAMMQIFSGDNSGECFRMCLATNIQIKTMNMPMYSTRRPYL